MLDTKTKGKATWLDYTVLGEARELSGLGEDASENDVFKTLIEMVYDYKMKEDPVDENFFENLVKILGGRNGKQ